MIECRIFVISGVVTPRLMEEGIDLLFQCVCSVLFLQLFSGGHIPAYSGVLLYVCDQFLHLFLQVIVGQGFQKISIGAQVQRSLGIFKFGITA